MMRVAVSVLVVLSVVDVSVTLKLGDPGVIAQTIPSTNNEPQKVELICDHNYEFDMGTDSCVPFVDEETEVPKCNSCSNGKCVGPENCQCLEGYNKTNDGCIPVCSKPCIHGFCATPNNCSCNPGYEKTNDECKPVCSSPCKNGYCSSPESCTCDPGYQKILNSCKPVCSSPCLYGYCSAPNNCTCNPGYHKTKEGCKPVCSTPCMNGYCSAPNNCSCNTGYQKKGDSCQPMCSKSCLNGYCTAPEYCTCESGYITSETEYNICYKPCLTPCDNGSCDLEGQCVCLSNYEFDNTTQKCILIKPINCIECNGNCTAEEECRCGDGKPCYMEYPLEEPEPVNMAGLDLTLISICSACLLLFILIVVVMQRIYQKRRKFENKSTTSKPVFGSVVYTVPNTLIQSRVNEEDNEGSCEEDTNNTLLHKEAEIP